MSSSCCGISEGWAVFRRKGSKEGVERGGRTRSPLRSGARGGGGFLWWLRPRDPRRFLGINSPASWPVSRIPGAVLVRNVGPAAHGSGGAGSLYAGSLYAPFLDPRGHQCACTGKRPVSWGEAHSAYNIGGDSVNNEHLILNSLQVCLIPHCQTWLFRRPSSLTHPLPSAA